MNYINFFQKVWGSSKIPPYVEQRLQDEIAPLLNNALPDDPYVKERIQCIFTDYRIKKSADIIEQNARAGESLNTLVGKIQKAKIFFQVGGVFTTGMVVIVGSMILSFIVGGMVSESWNNYRIQSLEIASREAIAKADYETAKHEFLRDVDSTLRACKKGKIKIIEGKKICLYPEYAWPSE